uniref:Uncharacterized protein n=1 Tax=Sphaerodactylus townsendi TaxID=933632 RepID=A0ACB8G3L3_9SAUR
MKLCLQNLTFKKVPLIMHSLLSLHSVWWGPVPLRGCANGCGMTSREDPYSCYFLIDWFPVSIPTTSLCRYDVLNCAVARISGMAVTNVSSPCSIGLLSWSLDLVGLF